MGVYITLVTAGDWHLEEAARARHQVYIDTWGTAFADVAKMLFEKELKASLDLQQKHSPISYGDIRDCRHQV